LRERREDIPLLARASLEQHCRRYRKSISGFEDMAIQVLLNHSWPGNIRELRNAVIQAGVMNQGGEITPQDFRLRSIMPPGIPPLTEVEDGPEEDCGNLEVMERRMIEEALAATGGHQQKAAARLGISRRTLSRKLKLYDSVQQRVAL